MHLQEVENSPTSIDVLGSKSADFDNIVDLVKNLLEILTRIKARIDTLTTHERHIHLGLDTPLSIGFNRKSKVNIANGKVYGATALRSRLHR